MNRSIFSIFTGFVVFFLAMALTVVHPAYGTEAKIIRIFSSVAPHNAISIEPSEIWVKPGTTVIWNNWAKADAHILFVKGEGCKEATSARSGFKYDPQKGCVGTVQEISKGGTASLMFEATGRFDYTVDLVGEKKSAKGTILVRPH